MLLLASEVVEGILFIPSFTLCESKRDVKKKEELNIYYPLSFSCFY